MPQPNPSLEAVGLSKRYGSFTALDNLSLKIEGPKCVGFLGPNGAGSVVVDSRPGRAFVSLRYPF